MLNKLAIRMNIFIHSLLPTLAMISLRWCVVLCIGMSITTHPPLVAITSILQATTPVVLEVMLNQGHLREETL